MSRNATVQGVAGRRRRRRAAGLHRRGERGRGRAGHHPPAAGDPGRRSGGALELQGREVRLVQRRDQRPAETAVHDPDVDLHRRRGDHRDAAAGVPGDPRSGHRRLVQLPEGPADPGVRAAAGSGTGRVPDGTGRRASARRSSANASNASCARTSATSSATTRRTRRRSPGRGSSSGPPNWTCTRWTPAPTGANSPRPSRASGCATSPSAAPRSAPSTSRSPTTRSSR